jgi:hypothetical protein
MRFNQGSSRILPGVKSLNRSSTRFIQSWSDSPSACIARSAAGLERYRLNIVTKVKRSNRQKLDQRSDGRPIRAASGAHHRPIELAGASEYRSTEEPFQKMLTSFRGPTLLKANSQNRVLIGTLRSLLHSGSRTCRVFLSV